LSFVKIDLSEQPRGSKGINVWASAGANSLSVENAPGFPNDSGAPFGGSAGMDFRTQCGALLGAAFTAGTQTQNFTKGSGGYFDQTDEALSIYTAYEASPVWGDAVATYGFFQDNIRRRVPLGILTDDNNASPDGHALALALRAGGDIKLGQITTGPVGGVVMQKVYLGGFAETGSTGVTALTFASQTRNSFVGQLGWRILADMGNWQPFADMKWNHEYGDTDNTVTTSLNTVAAPSYIMDAAPIASDWATASVGTCYKLNSQVTLRGAFLTTFLNSQVAIYGGELGMSVSF
jgi:outer membrane lipase/esterase